MQGHGVDRALEVIERNARAQQRLIVDLLNTAQIVRGTMRLQAEPVDLASVLAESIDTIRPAADAKHIAIRAQLRPGSSISGDPMRLRQIFANVLTNAVKFTPKHGRVDVGVAVEASSALVTIHDTGVGIAPEFLDHVFEPFSQQQPSGGGVGLGLSIVRHLVELHGATVSAASEGSGKGTTVSFNFPLLAVSQAGTGWVPTGRWADAPRLEGIHVLVVDDDPEARRLITLVLERAGATVMAVGTAAEGLATIQQRKPDILVADIGLPDEDGMRFWARFAGSAHRWLACRPWHSPALRIRKSDPRLAGGLPHACRQASRASRTDRCCSGARRSDRRRARRPTWHVRCHRGRFLRARQPRRHVPSAALATRRPSRRSRFPRLPRRAPRPSATRPATRRPGAAGPLLHGLGPPKTYATLRRPR